MALFATGPRLWTDFAGAVLWGAGAAPGFPLGLSAGSDDPAHAVARVGVVTSIGYCGFVGGPPLIGAPVEQTGLAPALLVVAAVTASSLVLAGALRAAPRTTYMEAADAAPATPAP
ncbi:hypothetical protein [Streptomyces sp. NPDC048385]|uniref:hypothetical protein n=1 Tax=unclassified Streptomyces TaxID=2593676 RepID=UPI00341261C4